MRPSALVRQPKSTTAREPTVDPIGVDRDVLRTGYFEVVEGCKRREPSEDGLTRQSHPS